MRSLYVGSAVQPWTRQTLMVLRLSAFRAPGFSVDDGAAGARWLGPGRPPAHPKPITRQLKIIQRHKESVLL